MNQLEIPVDFEDVFENHFGDSYLEGRRTKISIEACKS
jgi:hypothetical protein